MRSAVPAPSTRRSAATPFRTALLLAVAGAALSIVLARVHAQAHAGIASFCSISDTVNCDRVATSSYSVVLGLPVAIWGVLGYALAASLAAWGLRNRAQSAAAAGLLFLLSAAAVAVSVVLALVSELAIGALCLLCAGSWVLSVALLVAAMRACRGAVGACVGSGFREMKLRPLRTAAMALTGAGVLAFAAVAYPRYWERPRPEPTSRDASATPASIAADAGAAAVPASAPVVVEYSDYECPFCARAHEELRAIRKKRPDVVVVRRQFPLDASCNPALTRTIHPGACTLARAALCAREQGRFDQMDDALFRNQRERLPVTEVARNVGLDMDRFRSCMTSPESERQLEADVAAGIHDHVRATPTYVVGGTSRAGEFPLDLLPPAPVTGR